MKIFTIKLKDEDYKLLQDAVKATYDKDKHNTNYGVGTFIKECAIPKAKRVLKRKK